MYSSVPVCRQLAEAARKLLLRRNTCALCSVHHSPRRRQICRTCIRRSYTCLQHHTVSSVYRRNERGCRYRAFSRICSLPRRIFSRFLYGVRSSRNMHGTFLWQKQVSRCHAFVSVFASRVRLSQSFSFTFRRYLICSLVHNFFPHTEHIRSLFTPLFCKAGISARCPYTRIHLGAVKARCRVLPQPCTPSR